MDNAVRTKYVRWQWRTLIALMLGYICYYFLRKNFSAAIPAMKAELGLSKVQLGIFLTLNGIVYGVSRMINGLPPVEEFESGTTDTEGQLTGEKYKKFISAMVFRNPMIWGISIADFCVYVIRFTILEWGTSFLTQYKGFDITLAASIVAASELIGGVLGTIAAGWVTDHLFRSRTLRTSAIFTLGATICFTLFWRVPSGAPWIWSAIPIVASSFFIYGPQALLGVSCSQYATKRASGSANGFCGIFCYGATAISGIGFGWLADRPGMGWNAVFVVAIVFGLLGTLILSSFWRAPADGYEKAEEILKQCR